MKLPELKIFSDKKKNEILNKCFSNTLETTLKVLPNGNVFLITGDIPAMWLRDSSAQVMQYLYFLDNQDIKDTIKGLLKTQFELISIDPYANAFLEDESQESFWAKYVTADNIPKRVWERKFELDSLCWPFFLLTKYINITNDYSLIDDAFYKAFDLVIDTIKKERKHSELSSYFYKLSAPWLKNDEICGLETNKEEEKGLIWSGFRPSDDQCQYHYHIPDNMFFVSVLTKLITIFDYLKDENRKQICLNLSQELKELINTYGIKEVEGFGKIYISETNCIDKWHAYDDANVPSLLSIPYLEYPFMDNEIYQNTRKYILSKNNPYYYQGSKFKGIGSPHTPKDMVWPIAIAMQGITSNDNKEIEECLNMLFESAVDNDLMHESVDVNNPNNYTRPWFAWANSLFAEFVLKKIK